MRDVIVYTSSTCVFCPQVKAYLKENGVAFEERNIKEPQYRKELMSMGFMSVPVVKIEDETVLGFDKDKLDLILGL